MLPKIQFSNHYIFATQCHYLIYVETHNLSLKYQRFTQSGCKDIGIRKLNLWQKLALGKSREPV